MNQRRPSLEELNSKTDADLAEYYNGFVAEVRKATKSTWPRRWSKHLDHLIDVHDVLFEHLLTAHRNTDNVQAVKLEGYLRSCSLLTIRVQNRVTRGTVRLAWCSVLLGMVSAVLALLTLVPALVDAPTENNIPETQASVSCPSSFSSAKPDEDGDVHAEE